MSQLKVLHIIDQLALGGAERVAVNMSNALAQKGVETHLCVTRDDGPMRNEVSKDVHLFYLNKKSSFDLKAFLKLIRYIRTNGIMIVHAHSSSIYFGVILNMFLSICLVWHWHKGSIISASLFERCVIRILAGFSKQIFVVNREMDRWGRKELNIKTIKYLPNFPLLSKGDLKLNLPASNIKIAALFNFRYPKDHMTLIKAVSKVCSDVKVVCIGWYHEDTYYTECRDLIEMLGVQDQFMIIGQQSCVKGILEQCDIGVLCSNSEGLPMSLLEYGLVGLPVICSNVGECSEVLRGGELGELVDPSNVDQLSSAIQRMIQDVDLRRKYADSFHQHVLAHYSEDVIINDVIQRYYLILEQ